MPQNGHQNDASISIPKPPQKVLLKNWLNYFGLFGVYYKRIRCLPFQKMNVFLFTTFQPLSEPKDEEILVFLSEN